MSWVLEFKSNEAISPIKNIGVSEWKKYDTNNLIDIKKTNRINELLDEFEVSDSQRVTLVSKIKKLDEESFLWFINKASECYETSEVIQLLDTIEKDSNNTKMINDLKSVLNNLKLEDNNQYWNIFSLLDKWDLDWVIKELENPVVLESISIDLLTQDNQNNTNNYESFKQTIVSIDSSFIDRFDSIESWFSNINEKLTFWVVSFSSVDYSETNSVSELETWDGFVLESDGKSRLLSLKWSNYKLESNLDNAEVINDLDEKQNELNWILSPINEKLNALKNLLDYITKALFNWIEITEVKEYIKLNNTSLYNKLNLWQTSSIIDIKTKVTDYQWELIDKKQVLVKNSKKYVDNIVLENTLKANWSW